MSTEFCKANRADPDKPAPIGAASSESCLFFKRRKNKMIYAKKGYMLYIAYPFFLYLFKVHPLLIQLKQTLESSAQLNHPTS